MSILYAKHIIYALAGCWCCCFSHTFLPFLLNQHWIEIDGAASRELKVLWYVTWFAWYPHANRASLTCIYIQSHVEASGRMPLIRQHILNTHPIYVYMYDNIFAYKHTCSRLFLQLGAIDGLHGLHGPNAATLSCSTCGQPIECLRSFSAPTQYRQINIGHVHPIQHNIQSAATVYKH